MDSKYTDSKGLDSKGLAHALQWSYIVSILGALILWPLWDWRHAAGWLLGGLWSTTNVWAIKGLVEEFCNTRRMWIMALFAQVKLPILYGAGAVVLLVVPLSIGAGIAGFQIPFVIIVVEAVVHGSQETQSAEVSSSSGRERLRETKE